MKRVFISLDDCRAGMKIAESIHNDYGATVVNEDTILDQHIIRKLQLLGIDRVRIFDENENVINANSYEAFTAQYNENIAGVKDILSDMTQGKELNIRKVNSITDTIFNRISENMDIVSCINQIRGADEYTYTHCMNVSLICMLISKWLGLNEEKVNIAIYAGLLHDIGKSRVPPEILNKPGPLTDSEFAEMKKHPLYGFRMVEKVKELSLDIGAGILMHHEKMNGTGYPLGIKGHDIPQIARIISVADVYDAMTSKRVYKDSMSPFEVFEYMEKHTLDSLHHEIVRTFLNNIAYFYVGDQVVLNTGETAEIIYINPRNVSKPILRVDGKYVDMLSDSKIQIKSMV